MSADVKRFRDHAIDCRVLAKGARHELDAVFLEEIADALDEEASKIEAEKT